MGRNRLDDPLPLAAEFPTATSEQWHALVARALAGRSLDTLTARSRDGIAIAPLYGRSHEAPVLLARAPGARWQVLQRIDLPDPDAALAQVREDLANGSNGLVLVGADALGARGFGLSPSPELIAAILDELQPTPGATLELELGEPDMAMLIAGIVGRHGRTPGRLDLRWGIDPFGPALACGGFPRRADEIAGEIGRLGAAISATGFGKHLFAADGRIIHDAAGSEAQELAYVLAAAVACLRALEAHGIAVDAARRMIAFRLTADAEQFLTMVKFRALRALWRRVEESCGVAPEPIFITGETAWRTMACVDPYGNVLRATIAVAAAGLGGADAIAVVPFTAARGLPDASARRLARNTQLVLLEEAHLARVADPAAGTGWAEDLGTALCRAAWSLFQGIERAGGIAAALQHGYLQEEVARVRGARVAALADGADALVGVTVFPHAEMLAVSVLDVPRRNAPPRRIVTPITPLRPVRLAEPFEPPPVAS